MEPQGLPRLLQIASEGVNLDPPIPRIKTRPTFMCPGDVDRARQVLTNLREAALGEKPPNTMEKLFRSKSIKEQHTPEEFHAALDFVIKSSELPGVVEAQLDMGGNLNNARSASTSRLRKPNGKGQQDKGTEFLQATLAASILTQIPKFPSVSRKKQLTFMQLLIKSGSTGDSVSKALAEAIDDTEELVTFVNLLPNEGRANVNVNSGKAFCQGATIGTLECLKTVTRLSSTSPNDKSVGNAV